MKKLAAVVTVISALCLVLAGCAPAPQCPECPSGGVTTDLGGREVRMAVENAYPPFNVINEAGEAVGWDYDVGRGICEKLNCTPVFVEAAWEGVFEAMAAGEYDILFDGVTLTMPRALKVDYSDPYIVYGQVILVRADEDRPAFADEESFVASDVNVAMQIGTTNEITAIKLVGEERVVSFETYDMPVVALMAGDVDSVIIDEVAAIGFMGANPDQLKIAFPVSSGEMLALVLPPMSDLLAPVNWALQEMFADGSMDQICQTWLLRACTPAEE